MNLIGKLILAAFYGCLLAKTIDMIIIYLVERTTIGLYGMTFFVMLSVALAAVFIVAKPLKEESNEE